MPDHHGTILLIEDSHDTQDLLSELLTKEGYAVVAVSDGQQALDRLEAGLRPSAILLDLMLPHVSGLAVLDYLRSDRELRAIPTIVITGASYEQIRVVPDAVFQKPLNLDALVAKIDELTRPNRE